MIVGTITNVEGSNLTVGISEQLQASNSVGDSIKLSFREPTPFFDTQSPTFQESLILTSPKAGENLLVFRCDNRGITHGYATLDQTQFPGIRRSVQHFLDCKKNPELILEIPQLVKEYDDPLFLGYLVMYAATDVVLKHPDMGTQVLSEFLNIDKVADVDNQQLTMALEDKFSGSQVQRTTQATKESALKAIVDVAASDKKYAKDALRMLIKIADAGRIDLRPFVTQQVGNKLLNNFQKLFGEKGSIHNREIFMKLAAAKLNFTLNNSYGRAL